MSMWERERRNTRYFSSKQQSTGILGPPPGSHVQGTAAPLPPRCPWMGLEEVQSGSWCWHVYPGCWTQELQKNVFLTILLFSRPPFSTESRWEEQGEAGLQRWAWLSSASWKESAAGKWGWWMPESHAPSSPPNLICSLCQSCSQELQGQQTLREHLLRARHQPYRIQSRFSRGSQASRQHSRIPLGTHKQAYTLKWCCSLCLVPEAEKGRWGWGLTTASKINKRLTFRKQTANVVFCFQRNTEQTTWDFTRKL